MYYNLLGSDKLDGTLLISAVLLERIRYSGILFNKLTIHRLVLISIVIACKLYDDDSVCNSYWSDIGGVHLDELNNMELAFLKAISYNLFITDGKIVSMSRIITQQDIVCPSSLLLDINSSPSSLIDLSGSALLSSSSPIIHNLKKKKIQMLKNVSANASANASANVSANASSSNIIINDEKICDKNKMKFGLHSIVSFCDSLMSPRQYHINSFRWGR